MKEAANQGGLAESQPKAGMGGGYARNKQPRSCERVLTLNVTTRLAFSWFESYQAASASL